MKKNLIKIGFIVALGFFSTNAFAKDTDYKISVENSNSNNIKISVSNAENVSLRIFDKNNDEVYVENIADENYHLKSYNFTGMASGNYYLVVESAEKIEKYTITKDGNSTLINDLPFKTIQKPEFKVNNNLVTMNLADFKGPIEISVTDGENEYFKKVYTSINSDVKTDFNFNSGNSKFYTITVKSSDMQFEKVINLQ